jgi:CDP-diacylglycerol--glycerol-3-phosphate 3-phosphatidyltransferase
MLSDFYDGLIARKYNQVSEFGKLIDPIADKILVLSIFVLFVFIEPLSVPLVLVSIMILRDIVITAFRVLVIRREGKTLPAETLGKIKTTIQMLSILIMMIFYNLYLYKMLQHNLLKIISLTLTAISCIFSIISGCDYLYRYYLTFISRKDDR